jgi:beta-galactosidase
MLILDTAQPLAYYDHPFFGKYAAITRNRFGTGTLTYEGTVLSDPLQSAVVRDVLRLAGLVGVDQSLPAPVRVKHGVNRKGKTIHYFLNYSSEPEKFPYPYRAGTDLLTGTSVANPERLTLGPWDLAIIEER